METRPSASAKGALGSSALPSGSSAPPSAPKPPTPPAASRAGAAGRRVPGRHCFEQDPARDLDQIVGRFDEVVEARPWAGAGNRAPAGLRAFLASWYGLCRVSSMPATRDPRPAERRPEMTRTTLIAKIVLPGLLVVTMPALVNAEEVEGWVISIQERTRSGGDLEELRIRNRSGEEMRLELGRPGSCGDCVREGDRIRARLTRGDGIGEARQVRRLEVERTRTRYTFRDRSGNLTPTRVRVRSVFGGAAGDGGHSVATRQGQDGQGEKGGGQAGQGGGGKGGAGRGGGGGRG